MINQVVIVGRLTKDPDLRYTPSGVAVANYTVAASKKVKNDQGNYEEKTQFISCVVWRGKAESLANYKKKGDIIGTTGELQSRSYDDNETGKRVFVTEVLAHDIEFFPMGGGQQNNNNNQGYQNNNQSNYNNNNQSNYNGGQQNNKRQNDPFADRGNPIDIADDDLPF